MNHDVEVTRRILLAAHGAADAQSDTATRATLLDLLDTGACRITTQIVEDHARFIVEVADELLTVIDARAIGVHWVSGELVLLDFDASALVPEVTPDDLSGL